MERYYRRERLARGKHRRDLSRNVILNRANHDIFGISLVYFTAEM